MTENQYLELQKEWYATGETEDFGAGLTKYWHTGYRDPFLIPALIHDIEYTFKQKQRKKVDYDFIVRCEHIARKEQNFHKNKVLLCRAYLYYGIILAVGPMLWPDS